MKDEIKVLLTLNGEITEVTENGLGVLIRDEKKIPSEYMEIKKSCIKKEDLKLIYEGLPLTISILEKKINGTIYSEFSVKFHYSELDLELKKLKENV